MRTITVTITEDGDQLFLNTPGAAGVFCEAGMSIVRRASFVEPENAYLRLTFRAIRKLVSDNSRIAQWTRTWDCLWRVAIVGGPILPDRYTDRIKAIEAEICFLNKFFMGEKIK